MKPCDFWEIYAGGFTPLAFMRLFRCQDPDACAEAYVAERPALYGIVRRGSWHETFLAEAQHSRMEVATGLAAYLAETEPEWRTALEEASEEGRVAAPPTPAEPEAPVPDATDAAAEASPQEDAVSVPSELAD